MQEGMPSGSVVRTGPGAAWTRSDSRQGSDYVELQWM
jgi:hypothetical protein